MPYGTLTPEMEHTLAEVVKGQCVWDLGSGDLHYSRQMLLMGADRVCAVDKEYKDGGLLRKLRPSKDMQIVPKCYSDVVLPDGGLPVAFLSWPVNYWTHGLIDLIEAARTVVYLGSNTNGSSCGVHNLFTHLVDRKVLAFLPHRRNVMIVYGEGTRDTPLYGEEFAALTGQYMEYEDALEYSK